MANNLLKSYRLPLRDSRSLSTTLSEEMKKNQLKTFLLNTAIIVGVVAGLFLAWFYLLMRDAVPRRRLAALPAYREFSMTETEIRDLLGKPNWSIQRGAVTEWEYWRYFAGIRTEYTLFITLSNGVMVSWHQMD